MAILIEQQRAVPDRAIPPTTVEVGCILFSTTDPADVYVEYSLSPDSDLYIAGPPHKRAGRPARADPNGTEVWVTLRLVRGDGKPFRTAIIAIAVFRRGATAPADVEYVEIGIL